MPKDKEEKKTEITAETVLGPQLGSHPVKIVLGEYSEEIMTKINPIEKAWLSYFEMVPELEGGDFAKEFCRKYKAHSRSVDGWNVNKMIQMVAGSKGATAIGELKKKPGILARNLTQRDWKKNAEERGEVIIE